MLYRIAHAAPLSALQNTLLGEEVWARAALGACEHLAQVYHAFRRRYGARAVRRFVRRALVEYIYWEPRRGGRRTGGHGGRRLKAMSTLPGILPWCRLLPKRGDVQRSEQHRRSPL